MSSQEQSGGIGSTNLQINIESKGMSFKDVRDIANDVFKNNFATLADRAASIAEERARNIIDEIMNSLAEEKNAKLETFNNPDRQVALLEAQKAYVLSGDNELKDMVVRMVTDLSQEETRNLRSIVIGEAIKTVSTLTPRQICILATVYIVRYVMVFHLSIEDLAEHFARALFDRIPKFEGTNGDLRHLEYARCGKVSISSVRIAQIMHNGYPGLFQKGLSKADMESKFGDDPIPPSYLMTCRYNGSLAQIGALNESVLTRIFRDAKLTENQFSTAKAILKENLLDESIVLKMLNSAHPRFRELNDYWISSGIGHFELTSVGIAIAHSHMSCAMPMTDLVEWL